MEEIKMIYTVTFHVRPGKKIHTFWITDRQKALTFLESVKKYPKTLDYSTMQIPVNEATEYSKLLHKYAQEMGLTPAARSRLIAGKEGGAVDEMDELLED